MMKPEHTGILALALAVLIPVGLARAGAEKNEPLEGPEWKILGGVTGFHSVKLKNSGFEVRLLEADGSPSVAQDPVTLYVVVTNNEASDLVERTWRLGRGVARVRGLTPSACGIDVKVEVDRVASHGRVVGRAPKVLHLCFLSTDGKLQTDLKGSETSR